MEDTHTDTEQHTDTEELTEASFNSYHPAKRIKPRGWQLIVHVLLCGSCRR